MTETTASLSILIAEDHELARYGLVMALEDNGGFKVVAEADNGQQALDAVKEYSPDIVLMDIGMPVMDGVAATKEIKTQFPNTHIIMLTSHNDEDEILGSLAAGADAYCMKDIKIERLCQVIEMVREGAIWLDPAIAEVVMHALPGRAADPKKPHKQVRKRYNTELTDREQEVLEWIVAGKSNKEIAKELDVTIHTAKAHVCNIIQKLAVDDRTQVAVKALKEGLVSTS